jgi:hypothetical protein
LFLRLVVRVRVYLLWCIVGVVGAAPERINLPHIYSHTCDLLHGGISEVMATCVVWSFRSIAWSSCRSLDLTRSVFWCVVGLRWWPGRGGFSGARILVRTWGICRSSSTSSMGDDGSWSKTTQGRLPVDVPQQHVPFCMQKACSSTHKASLEMVLSWILQ